MYAYVRMQVRTHTRAHTRTPSSPFHSSQGWGDRCGRIDTACQWKGVKWRKRCFIPGSNCSPITSADTPPRGENKHGCTNTRAHILHTPDRERETQGDFHGNVICIISTCTVQVTRRKGKGPINGKLRCGWGKCLDPRPNSEVAHARAHTQAGRAAPAAGTVKSTFQIINFTFLCIMDVSHLGPDPSALNPKVRFIRLAWKQPFRAPSRYTNCEPESTWGGGLGHGSCVLKHGRGVEATVPKEGSGPPYFHFILCATRPTPKQDSCHDSCCLRLQTSKEKKKTTKTTVIKQTNCPWMCSTPLQRHSELRWL